MSKFLTILSVIALLLVSTSGVFVFAVTTLPTTTAGNGTVTTTTAVPATTAAPTPAPTSNLTFEGVRTSNDTFYPNTFAVRFANDLNLAYVSAGDIDARLKPSNASIVLATIMDVNATAAQAIKTKVAAFSAAQLSALGVSSLTEEGSSTEPKKKIPVGAIAGGVVAGVIVIIIILVIMKKKSSGSSGTAYQQHHEVNSGYKTNPQV